MNDVQVQGACLNDEAITTSCALDEYSTCADEMDITAAASSGSLKVQLQASPSVTTSCGDSHTFLAVVTMTVVVEAAPAKPEPSAVRATGGSVSVTWPWPGGNGAPLTSMEVWKSVGSSSETLELTIDASTGYRAATRLASTLQQVSASGSGGRVTTARCPPGLVVGFGYTFHQHSGAAPRPCAAASTKACSVGAVSCSVEPCCEFHIFEDKLLNPALAVPINGAGTTSFTGEQCETECCTNDMCDFFVFDSGGTCTLYSGSTDPGDLADEPSAVSGLKVGSRCGGGGGVVCVCVCVRACVCVL